MSMKKLAERWVGKGWIEPIATPPAKLERPKNKEEIEAAAFAEHESLKGHAFYSYRGQCYSSMKKLAERWVGKSWIEPISTPPAKLERPKNKEEIEAAALAEHESLKSNGQITFYPYDRGQCYNKGSRAIMAFVNLPGSCAHYIFVEDIGEWEFVQFPHMSTEKRCAERSGYRNVEEFRAYLFSFFNSYIIKNDLFGFNSLVWDGRGRLPGELEERLPNRQDGRK